MNDVIGPVVGSWISVQDSFLINDLPIFEPELVFHASSPFTLDYGGNLPYGVDSVDREHSRSIIMQKQIIAETNWILNCDWSTAIFKWNYYVTFQPTRVNESSMHAISFILPFGYIIERLKSRLSKNSILLKLILHYYRSTTQPITGKMTSFRKMKMMSLRSKPHLHG